MNDVKIVFGSDFHIGNSKISAIESHLNISDWFYPEVIKSNIVFLGGDFFHRLLKLDEVAALESISIAQELISFAEQHNLKIRILRGTFSHDRQQNEIFLSVLSKSKKNVDLNCVDTISLELIKEYDLRVLYLPDNLPYKNKEQVMEVIHSLLKTYGWKKVDIVVGHGYFEHVFPVNVPHPPIVFEYDDFKDIVSGYILMGHVHTTSVYKNIIYAGSFERFAHNEEEQKGFYTVERNRDNWSYQFVENKDTPYFFTIDLKDEDIDICMNQIDIFVREKFGEKDGFFRLAHPNTETKQILLQMVHDKYPSLISTAKSTKDTIEKRQFIKEFQTCQYVLPTKENLADLTIDFIKTVKGNTTLTKEIVNKLLLLD